MKYPSTLQIRIWVAAFFVAALSVGAGSLGVWLTNSTTAQLQEMRTLQAQKAALLTVEESYRAVLSATDTILLARDDTSDSTQNLNNKTNEFNRLLSELGNKPLGLSAESIESNRPIISNMKEYGAYLGSAITRISTNVQQSNFTAASQLRNTRIAELQASMDADMKTLEANLDRELGTISVAATRAHTTRIWYWIVLIGIGVGLSVLIAVIGRGAIVLPLRQLSKAMRRASQGDLSRLQAYPGRDEIGEVVRAFSQLVRKIHESKDVVDQNVHQRTKDIEQRLNLLQLAAQVAQEIAITRDTSELLDSAATLIHERFGLSLVGIFLVDGQGDHAVLRSMAGNGSEAALEEKFSLEHGDGIPIEQAVVEGQAVTGRGATSDRDPSPSPGARSEVDIPLVVESETIGVLNLHSEQEDFFDQQSIDVYQMLANQLARAIHNSRQLEQAQVKLLQMESMQALYNREAWDLLGRERTVLGYEYTTSDLKPLTQLPSDEVPPISIPLSVRGVEIGAIDVWPRTEKLRPQELEMLEAIGGRVSQAMESARLFDEAQAHALREQAINELSVKISHSLELETVLGTALKHLGELPNVAEVSVHVLSEEDL